MTATSPPSPPIITRDLYRFQPEEQRAWKPPALIKPSAWAAKHRVLGPMAARPGPWLNENAPYLAGIMDVCNAPGVTQVSIMKAAQIGGSEALRNLIAYWSSVDPGPIGLALPNKDKGQKIVANDLIPMYEDIPVLRELLTGNAHDVKRSEIRLNNSVIIHLMWAGSAAALASVPIRYAVCDEVDKFAPWTGREADAVSLVQKRLRTFEDRALLVNISTPTTRYGKIFQLWETSSVRLHYHVPCPHCGKFDRLYFPNLRFDRGPDDSKQKQADHVLQTPGACWYECPRCGERIEEEQRHEMILRGRWTSDDRRITDAEAIDEWPVGTRIGFQISAMYCRWTRWAEVAAEFILSMGDMAATMNFRNSTLGEPYEDQLQRATANVFREKAQVAKLDEGVVPKWACKVIAAADTQKDHFYLVIRAWGPLMKSARVWHGMVETFDQLDALCLHSAWNVEDDAHAPMPCDLVLIDSGGTKAEGESESRTTQVYRWAIRRQHRVRCIKGMNTNRTSLFIRQTTGLIGGGGRKSGKRPPKGQVPLWMLDTHHFSDELQHLIDREDGGWMLNRRSDEAYERHLSNAHKILVRDGSKISERWVPITAGARIDYRDCEVYQVAGAYMADVHTLVEGEDGRPQSFQSVQTSWFSDQVEK